jgi:hypothetical protein
MKTYILEKKQLFLILLQALAVICQFAINSASAAESIIPRAKLPSQVAKPTARPPSATVKTSAAPKKTKKVTTKAPLTFCSEILRPLSPQDLAEAQLAKDQAIAFAEMPPTAPIEPPLPEEALEDIFKTIHEANQLRYKYESSHDRKEEDRLAFLEKAKEYISKLKDYLTRQGIETTESELAPELQNEVKMSWPTLIISSAGKSRLARFSNGLNSRYQAELIIDFLWLARNEAGAAFLPVSNKLIISSEALKTERATIKEMHEVLHVRFKAQREQREVEAGAAPLQMFFISSEPIKSDKYIHNYELEMPFEEIWTHSYEIGALAVQLDGQPNAEKQADLVSSVRSLVGLAETADKAVERAKEAGLSNQVDIEEINKVSHTVFKSTDEFIFAVALPPEAKENLIDYAISEMTQAQRLSRFVRDYWLQAESLTPEELLKKASEFRSSLLDFVKELDAGRSTAEATFDIIV